VKAKHTPGKWDAKWLDNDWGWVMDENGNYLAQIVTKDEDGKVVSHKQQEYNGILMAAAPYLLQALKDMVEAGHLGVKLNVKKSEHYSWMVAESIARKAILQAEGR